MANIGFGSGFLSDAATGYFEGLFKPNLEEVRAKREQETRDKEADIALKQAHALYYGRPQKGTARPMKVGKDIVWVDENGAEVLFKGEPDAPKTLETIRAETLRGMEERMGQKYGLPRLPISGWKSADFNEPFLDPLRDFVGIGRSPLVTTPGGSGAETRPKRGIGGYGDPVSGETPAPRQPSPVTPDAAAPTSVQPKAVPPPPKQPPPGQTAAPPKPAAKVPPGTEPTAATPDPYFLKHYESRLPHLTVEDADKQWALLTDPRATTKPQNLAAFLAAYRKTYGKLPPGVEPTGMTTGGTGEQPGAVPVEPPKGGPTAAVPPTDTASRTSLPPITPPPQPVTWGRERDTPLNNEQLTAKATEAWQRQKEWEVAEQGRLMAQRQLDKDEEARDLRALGGEPTPELREMTLKLNASGKVKGKDFTKLTPDEQRLVIDTKNLPKRRKEEQSWKKLAQPSINELNALQTAQDLTTMILPLIENNTVGWRGRAAGVGTWLRSQVMRNRFYTEAEEKLNATPEGKKLLAKLGQEAVNAQVAADVETNDPQVRADMNKIATRARLQTLSSVLMYAHALAQKRITGGSQRGLIKPDMDEAHKLFDPDLFFTAPEQLMANLQTLQGVIQAARGRVEDDVRSYHFAPIKGIKGRLNWTYQPDEVAEEAPSPVAPPPESAEDRVRRGPSVR